MLYLRQVFCSRRRRTLPPPRPRRRGNGRVKSPRWRRDDNEVLLQPLRQRRTRVWRPIDRLCTVRMTRQESARYVRENEALQKDDFSPSERLVEEGHSHDVCGDRGGCARSTYAIPDTNRSPVPRHRRDKLPGRAQLFRPRATPRQPRHINVTLQGGEDYIPSDEPTLHPGGPPLNGGGAAAA